MSERDELHGRPSAVAVERLRVAETVDDRKSVGQDTRTVR
jgi:hypothetical protein